MFYLVILFEIDINLEIYFYYTILLLYLAISLELKDSRKLLLNIKKIV